MPFHPRSPLAVFSLLFVATFASVTLIAQDNILVVTQSSRVFDDSRLLNESAVLPAGSVVLGNQFQQTETKNGVWRISPSQSDNSLGWVDAKNLTPIRLSFVELKARALAFSINPYDDAVVDVPALIDLATNPAIKETWIEVNQATIENEALPEEMRIPDPLFSRSELWSLVANYPDALKDLIKALKYARMQNMDSVSYGEHVDKLFELIEKLERVPKPLVGSDSDLFSLSRSNFGKGVFNFRSGHLDDAVVTFGHAIQLNPDEAVYWYYRAVTNKRRGSILEARHDAIMGVFFEQDREGWRSRAVTQSLINIQGEDRMWLESFRNGTAMDLLYQ